MMTKPLSPFDGMAIDAVGHGRCDSPASVYRRGEETTSFCFGGGGFTTALTVQPVAATRSRRRAIVPRGYGPARSAGCTVGFSPKRAADKSFTGFAGLVSGFQLIVCTARQSRTVRKLANLLVRPDGYTLPDRPVTVAAGGDGFTAV